MKIKEDFMQTIPELEDIFNKCPGYQFAYNVEELIELTCGNSDTVFQEVKYNLPDDQCITEATVARVKNGVAINYPEPYMRRRDPDCMLIGDENPSDKPKYKDKFGKDFSETREETLNWLADQQLAAFAFRTGNDDFGDDAVAVVPANAAFFALGLAMLQGILSKEEITEDFSPKSVIYVAPVFRHTHFKGKQIVVHNRSENMYEIFSYNLYPGPSAKKGVYGILINQGEKEDWIVPHCSAVQVVTPYDNKVTFMHEGASGGGKSEMLEQPHRLYDGRILKGTNTKTGEKRYLEINRTCDLHPVCDDMALCHPSIQKDDDRLWIMDAENGWFLRVNHIDEYGTDPNLEKLTAKPTSPLFFLNIDAVPNSRALIWDHIEDSAGVPCPNPRVIVPRASFPDIVNKPVSIDYRSFGVRTPACTRENPTYGILGLFHILPPALAWLWRLVAPRGFNNPSIVDSDAMSSEGVGTYWAFSTGLKLNQANLILEQIERNKDTRYTLIPNQHVGSWETGFMPQWLTREYLARRGSANFHKDQLTESRSPLLGYALKTMRIEGTRIAHWFLEVDTQPEVGKEGYDAGAKILRNFFSENLLQFKKSGLSDIGTRIIECCMDNGSVDNYVDFFPNHLSYIEND